MPPALSYSDSSTISASVTGQYHFRSLMISCAVILETNQSLFLTNYRSRSGVWSLRRSFHPTTGENSFQNHYLSVRQIWKLKGVHLTNVSLSTADHLPQSTRSSKHFVSTSLSLVLFFAYTFNWEREALCA